MKDAGHVCEEEIREMTHEHLWFAKLLNIAVFLVISSVHRTSVLTLLKLTFDRELTETVNLFV